MWQGIERFSIPCHTFQCCSSMATFQHTLGNTACTNDASNMLPSVCPALLYNILCLVRNCMYSGHLSALTPGFPMIFTCLPAALFAFIHASNCHICIKVYQCLRTRFLPPGNLLQEEKYINVEIISYKIQSYKIIYKQM